VISHFAAEVPLSPMTKIQIGPVPCHYTAQDHNPRKLQTTHSLKTQPGQRRETSKVFDKPCVYQEDVHPCGHIHQDQPHCPLVAMILRVIR